MVSVLNNTFLLYSVFLKLKHTLYYDSITCHMMSSFIQSTPPPPPSGSIFNMVAPDGITRTLNTKWVIIETVSLDREEESRVEYGNF